MGISCLNIPFKLRLSLLEYFIPLNFQKADIFISILLVNMSATVRIAKNLFQFYSKSPTLLNTCMCTRTHTHTCINEILNIIGIPW